MSLRHSYTLIAPLYDLALERSFAGLRRQSLQRLSPAEGQEILISGIGTGLDIPHLPSGARYTGIDLTPAMLRKAEQRRQDRRDIQLHTGDAMQLQFDDGQFDAVVMHLILAVVPQPLRALQEALRVTRPGGRVLILDKFIRPGEKAYVRKLLSPVIGRLATRTDVMFEPLLEQCTDVELVMDEPVALGGWFRNILLRKG